MVCDFTNHLTTIFPNVEMLHNNILGAIEEMQSKVDIENEKKQHNAFEKTLSFRLQCLWVTILWLFTHGQTC
jgi:hypothetical protein